MQPLNPKDLLLRSESNSTTPSSQPPAIVSPTRFQELERLIQDMPLTVEPYVDLAQIYLNTHRWSDARRVLEKAVARFPEDLQANDLFEDAQMSRSMELCRQAEEEHLAEPTQLTREALQSCQVALSALKEKVFRQRLQRYPQRYELMIQLADSLQQLDQLDEAVELLRQAGQHPELRADAMLKLGKLYEKAQKIPEALSSYRRAALFRVPPPSPEIQLEALSAAADLSERHQLIDSARRYIELLVTLNPNDSQLRQRLAQLNERAL